MKKRILSILLLCCMVLTLLPTSAFAAGEIDEQFTLVPGGTYYFDLSGVSIPGTADDALPDKTMHYVPFTYAGTVDAYKLTSAMAATDEYAEKNKYAHSLFVADYTVTHTVSWDELNAGRLIFGRDYAAGGVDYILRAPSVGSGSIGSAESQRGTPPSNEWDRILDKNDGYIKNWFGMFSWGQDTLSTSESDRAARGHFPPGGWSSAPASHQDAVAGFRPVLEVLGSDGLKAVTLDLGGGKLGNSSEDIQIIVKKGSEFTAPASDGLTRPDGSTGSHFMWLGSDGKLYAPGDNVPADVTRLTAQFDLTEQFDLAPGGTYYFDLSGVGVPGTANGSLPDTSLHYVPFTYVGIVDAYKLTSAMATTDEYAQQNEYAHSLFVADFAVTHTTSWVELNTAGLIFGKGYAAGGVGYTLRAPSVGSDDTGSGNSQRGTPQSNEWDRMLDKDDGYIKNWSWMYSWGQDTESLYASYRAGRGDYSARYWYHHRFKDSNPSLGFRPVLEVLNPDALGSDGLKAVTIDLGGGKLGGSSEDIQIIVKNGESFTAPASEGLTRPDGNTDSYFMWLGSDGKSYAPGDSVPANVDKLTAQFDEQFTLTIGDTYWFDLSGAGIPGTVNDTLPDNTLHYVPFTYAGTVDAYKLTSAIATTDEYAQQNEYLHSLFVADYAVKYAVSWNTLNDASLIFGKNYAAGGVDYMLRAPSVGSDDTGSGNSQRGTPQSNEWDRMLDKYDGYIKNWSGMFSWGQDTPRSSAPDRAGRGDYSARYWYHHGVTDSNPSLGFRPVLEVLKPDALGSDGLKAVTLDLGGGKLGGSSDHIQIIVKNGSAFTAPASDGLTRPDGATGSNFKWLGSDGKLYAPGDNVPADVTRLTAQFDYIEQFTLTTGDTYWFDLSGVGIPGTANESLPDKTMHYVPFTYAGTVDAYTLTSEMATTEAYAEENKYLHSLFVADYAVKYAVSWNTLNDASLIFGKNYAAGGVDYMLRAPSVGSDDTGSGNSQRGTPQSNEWDRMLDKYDGYIKNWSGMFSWGQDTPRSSAPDRAGRGDYSARYWYHHGVTDSNPSLGFRPVLEVLKPDALGSDGLKAVTLDLGGGKLGGSSDHIQIIVKNGSAFTAPASDGLTRPDGATGSNFKWLGSDGKLYAPGDNVPADVTKLTAQFDEQQFTLTIGDIYWFDLSGAGIPGTANGSLPDTSLHYVPFTYVGTVDAYKLTSEMATTDEYAQQNEYAHSLLVADYAVTHALSWDNLNAKGLIFGKNYTAGAVDYTLRAPSVGSGRTGSNSERGTPQSNEWDRILDKYDGYIKNWSGMFSWGQDTWRHLESFRAFRGGNSARYWDYYRVEDSNPSRGFRPVLEVLNPGSLGSDGLKAVTLDLGGGKLGNSSEDIQIIVKSGESFAAPASDGLTRPDGNTGNYFKWLGSDGELYDPGGNVPAVVTKLTAQFAPSSHSVTITTDTLPDGKVGEAYSQILTATGTTPITWRVENGDLPTGLSLNKDTGEISGTPTAAGTSTFTVKATNSAGSDTKELSITITKDAPAEHIVTVTNDGNGTASASHAKAVVGTEITLTAMPKEGYHFKEWQVISGNVTIKDDKFLMPSANVEVKAIFEKDAPPAPTEFIVTFDGNGGKPSVGSMTTTNRKLNSLPSASQSKHSFDGWYTEKSGGTKITTDTVFHANTTVYARWIYIGGGGGAAVPPATDNVTNNPADKRTTADLTPAVKDNKAETTVDAKTADKIVDKAVENKSTEVVIDAAGNNNVASSEVAIPEKTVKELAEKTDANLVIKTDNGTVDLDKTALDAVAAQAGNTGFVRLIIETIKSDENICHVNLKLITSNGAVTDFRGGNVKVTINLTKELAAKDVVCVYINDNGIYTLVNGQKNADGTYTFTTGHFSEYAVMAKEEADKKIAEQLDTMIKDVNLKVRTSKTSKKNIKAVVSGDVKALTDAGYTVKYKFYRSEKKASKYVGKVTKTSKTYINTAGKKGTKYYYKAKALVYDGDKLVGQTVLKQCKYGVRTWSK